MKRVILLLAIFSLSAGFFTGIRAEGKSEEEAVKKTIEDAYIKGVHVNRDSQAMRKGFHPDFLMYSVKDGEIAKTTLDEWAGAIDALKKKSDAKSLPETKWEFPMVDVTGNTAVAKIEVYKDGKHVFTDYMSLYKFEDGWKIVAKVFNRH